MAEGLPLSKPELALLASLVRAKVRFLVVGLSAAALQGAPVVTEDVDLWFENLNDPRLIPALRKVGAAYVPPFELNPPMLAGLGSQPFDVVLRMDGLKSFAEEFQHARTIVVGKTRLRVLPLSRILASKEAANRPKDRSVIPVLRDALIGAAARRNRNARQPRPKSRQPSRAG